MTEHDPLKGLIRPMLDRDIEELHPQALVDRSAALASEPVSRPMSDQLSAEIMELAGQIRRDGGVPPENIGSQMRRAVNDEDEDEGDDREPVFEDLGPNVQRLNVNTRHNLKTSTVLQMAHEAQLDEIVISGIGPDGEEFFMSSSADAAKVLWLLETGKMELMSRGRSYEDEIESEDGN